ncbi:MAG: hypothetical protein ACM336_14635 [Acidobacteriota bacterium]
MSLTAAQPNSRVRSALDRVEAVFSEQFAELARWARRETAGEFGEALRRFLSSQGEDGWASALIASIGGFCSRAILMTVHGTSLKVAGVLGPPEGAPSAGTEVALEGALAAAVKSPDALVTTTTAAEISSPAAAFFERAGAANCAVVPVVAGGRAAAVLIGAGEGMDVGALETMAALAGLIFDRRAKLAPDLSHPRAQRFARVRVAEILLYKTQAVRDGRSRKKIYAELREEIDAARAAYAREFGGAPDYLHLELLRTLANDEVSALGEEYPGPLR